MSGDPQAPAFSIKRVDSLADIPAAAIDRLTHGKGVFASRPYLAFMQEMRKDKGVWHATCTRADTEEHVAFCPVYDGGATAGSYWDPNRHYLRRAVGFTEATAWDGCRFLGCRSGYGWSPMIDATLPVPDQDAALRAMLSAVAGPPLAAMFMSDSGRAAFVHAGFADDSFFLAGANAVINLAGRTFNDYLRELPRPDNARREISAFTDSGATVEIRTLPDAWNDLAAPFTELATKYRMDSSPAAEIEEMERLNDAMGTAAGAAILLRDADAIGGLVFLVWENTMYIRQAGFDYRRTGDAFEYFNLTYYSMVRHAIDCGIARIDYGMATYRAKLTRGATIEPLWGTARNVHGRTLTSWPGFQDWDSRRRISVASMDIDALEQADLP